MRDLIRYYADAVMAAAARGAGCALGCHGHGDCMNGTCLCEIRYAGDQCDGPNMPYHACIGGVFLVVAFVCIVQLTVCIVTEYRRLKVPTFLRACKLTTQKMLYFVVFLASLIRGAYFVSPQSAFREGWATTLLSAFYPLLICGSSLIVCFWAEVFHLRDIRWERPRFLSKSRLAYVTFNLMIFFVYVTEYFVTNYANLPIEQKKFYLHVFNGCYAVVLFIVVIFYLIYGVEVYFKLRGGFLKTTKVCTIISSRPGASSAEDADDVQRTLVTKQGVLTDLADSNGTVDPRSVNQSQLHQSRFGLVVLALMHILIAGLLASETLGQFWKVKVPVVSRNWHDLVFRLAEIGVVIWYPCALWNCMAPERLWLLNPRRLLSKQLDDAKLADLVASRQDAWSLETDSLVSSVGSPRDCWICYDSARPEPLIKPCRCTGDVSAVHHDCLRRWLVESSSTTEELKCKVCSTPYIVQETNRVDWERGFTATEWLRTALVVVAMGVVATAAWLLVQMYTAPVPRVLITGFAMLFFYVACRFLGTNMVTAYNRAKVSSIRILTEPSEELMPKQNPVSTISRTVTVEIASKVILEQALKGDP